MAPPSRARACVGFLCFIANCVAIVVGIFVLSFAMDTRWMSEHAKLRAPGAASIIQSQWDSKLFSDVVMLENSGYCPASHPEEFFRVQWVDLV